MSAGLVSMQPIVIPFLERVGRAALRARGFRTRFVQTRVGRAHVYDGRARGALPTLVLLHGIGASAASFLPLIPRLLPQVRRLVALEYPGHGFSPEPTSELTPNALLDAVTEALDGLLEEPAIVVGNSLGGATALHYAVTRPRQVTGLILLSPAGARSTEEEWRALRASFDLRSRADAVRLLERIFHRPPLLTPLIAHEFANATFNRPAVRQILAGATREAVHNPAALSAMPMPVLLVWGRSEHLLPESHLAYYRQHLPAHTVVERPERLGHMPQAESPRWVADRIIAFAREVHQRHMTV
jgi:pimeloyl-ACP methyl ester carboxylesterase